MTKYNFNQLGIDEQINYFNIKLGNGFKITEICNELGISYNTIRDRFTRNGFTYNKLAKQYECLERVFSYDEEVLEKVLEKLVVKVFNSNTPKCDKSCVEDKKLVCDVEGNVVNRSFRIYDKTLENFTKFCDKSNYNQYDILSKFIEEGIAKYSQ